MKQKQNNHLAEGEVTGHFHEVVGNEVKVFEDVFGDNSLLVNVPEQAVVTHQEHETIEIPAGKYRTDQVLEYDSAEEEVRRIRD